VRSVCSAHDEQKIPSLNQPSDNISKANSLTKSSKNILGELLKGGLMGAKEKQLLDN